MATYIIGPHDDIPQITSGDTVNVRLLMTDAADALAGKTGVTWNDAGMDVDVAKPGGDFAAFPTFASENWHEVGNGWYELIILGANAPELALLDTTGAIQFYVNCTATNEAHLTRKIVPADVVRDDQWTDARAAKVDNLDAAVTTRAAAATALTTATWTGARAAALDELLAANMPADLDTMLSRLSAVRAGYLDNLNLGGLAASAADVAGITQAQRVRVIVPMPMERPDSGSKTFRLWMYAYDETHQAEDLDSNPTITAENDQGTDRSANLGSVTKPGATTGQYYVDYTVADGHTIEGLVFKVDATEGAVTTQYPASSIVVDTTAVDFTAADRTKLEDLFGRLITTGAVPDAAAGGNGGLPTVDGNNYIAGIQGAKNTLDDLNDVAPGAEMGLADGAITTPKFADGAMTPAKFGVVYHSTVEVAVDGANSRDCYSVVVRDARDLTTIQPTGVTIAVRADNGAVLFAAQSMDYDANTDAWYYTTSTQMTAGVNYKAKVVATISAVDYTTDDAVLRDSSTP